MGGSMGGRDGERDGVREWGRKAKTDNELNCFLHYEVVDTTDAEYLPEARMILKVTLFPLLSAIAC